MKMTPVDISVNEHIHAVGGWPTKYLHRADMVLLVNTPASGVTLEASAPSNNGTVTRQQERFMKKTWIILCSRISLLRLPILPTATARIMRW